MSAIQFNLTKDTNTAPIAFSLSKVQKYIVELYWESKHDLDTHAIALSGGSYTGVEDILSTYNPNLVKLENPSVKHNAGSKEPFKNSVGSLIHNGDKRTGINVDAQQPDETMIIEMSKLANDINEVSFFVTSHPPSAAKFSDVNNAKIVIKDDNNAVLLTANLTNDFDQYDMVQMGSIVKNTQTGAWDFNPVAVGLNGTFNDVLGLLA